VKSSTCRESSGSRSKSATVSRQRVAASASASDDTGAVRASSAPSRSARRILPRHARQDHHDRRARPGAPRLGDDLGDRDRAGRDAGDQERGAFVHRRERLAELRLGPDPEPLCDKRVGVLLARKSSLSYKTMSGPRIREAAIFSLPPDPVNT